jgi:hypothetical protein
MSLKAHYQQYLKLLDADIENTSTRYRALNAQWEEIQTARIEAERVEAQWMYKQMRREISQLSSDDSSDEDSEIAITRSSPPNVHTKLPNSNDSEIHMQDSGPPNMATRSSTSDLSNLVEDTESLSISEMSMKEHREPIIFDDPPSPASSTSSIEVVFSRARAPSPSDSAFGPLLISDSNS